MNAYLIRAVVAVASVVISLSLFDGVAWLADPVVAGGTAAQAGQPVVVAAVQARPASR
jgi:hypothetical protein